MSDLVKRIRRHLVTFSVDLPRERRTPIRRSTWRVSAGRSRPGGAYVRVGDRLAGFAIVSGRPARARR